MMGNVPPFVTVVMPTFNEESATLKASLSSVAAQTLNSFECIVIDESTDEKTVRTCKEYCQSDERFHYIHPEQRLGLAASLNLGISLANSPLIARFDSDDVCIANRLQLQVDFMEANSEIGVLGGNLEIVDGGGEHMAFRKYPSDHLQIERQMHFTTPLAHPTVIFRKSLIERFGGYDPEFRFSEDLDLWLRFLNGGVKFANLPDVLVRYRQEQTNRDPRHWEFNLRARLKNFTSRRLARRLLGVCGIFLWSKVPPATQRNIFKCLILNRH